MRTGLAGAWWDLYDRGGFAIFSPVFAFPAAFVVVYGLGGVLYGSRIGSHGITIALATAAGLAGYVLGVAVAWRRVDDTTKDATEVDELKQLIQERLLRRVSFALIALGMLASVAYLVAIGGIPLFMESVEDARVAAAERGGAPLRVLSFMAHPGLWVLAGQAGARRRPGPLVAVASLAAILALLQILTANRAPAFGVVQVTIVAALLGAGLYRLRLAGVAAILVVALGLVILAGAVGGYRLSNTPVTWRDPDIAHAVASGDRAALIAKGIQLYLVVPVQNFGATLTAVPDLIDWRYGYTYLQPIVTMLPGHQTTFDQDLKASLGQEYAGGGTVPSILGEAYANFGPPGWVIVPFLVGLFLTRLFLYARRRRSAAAWTLYGYALLHLSTATIGGIVVANIFPYAAYVLLGLAAFGDRPILALAGEYRAWRRRAR